MITSDNSILKNILNLLYPHKGKVILSLTFSLIISVLCVITPSLSRIFIDEGVLPGNISLVATFSLFIILLSILNYILLLLQSLLHINIQNDIQLDLSCMSFNHLIKLKMKYFEENGSFTIITSVNMAIQEICQIANEQFLNIILELTKMIGGAIGLAILDIRLSLIVVIMLFSNSYKKIERAIIAFVSVIGLSFLYELFLVDIDWPVAVRSWVVPDIPQGSMLIIMSVLGAVVMPHNLFLHSEVIQSHEYNKQDESSIRKVLKYEFYDTLFSMIVGWAINSAMILLAAATFFRTRTPVEELQQAKSLLDPLLGSHAGIIFALALLMAGISSTITSGMAAGSIFAGIFGESYHIKDIHSKVGILISLGIALVLIFFIENPFYGLIISQMILSIQLPFTVFLQVGLTSSKRVMGKYANSRWSSFVLYTIAVIVSALNIMLLLS